MTEKTITGPSKSPKAIYKPVRHLAIESEDGDNSLSQGNINEPEPNTQLGEDGTIESVVDIDDSDGDSLVNVNQIIENHRKLAGMRLRGGTPAQYEYIFRKFATAVNLEQYTKRQLKGNKGKELLLLYLLDKDKVPEPSKRLRNASLKSIWEDGLGIQYPINARKHLGELPPMQRRQSPRDSDVLPWIKALEHEEEPYLKVLILFIFQLGIRPSHACLLRWKHMNFEQDGRPTTLLTTGREAGNKRMTPVKARLPPDLSNALGELRSRVRDALPDDLILPYRKKNGQFERNKAMTTILFTIQWRRFERKHLLDHLRPVDLRHWVATTCRKAGLSLAARNALQGHKFRSDNQGENYDNPQDIDILEEQETVLPHGPIGFVCPKVEISQELPEEAIGIVSEYLSGTIGTMELASRFESLKIRRLNRKPENTIVA